MKTKKKMWKRFTAIGVAAVLLAGTTATAFAGTTYKSWKAAYKAVLKDWTITEEQTTYGDDGWSGYLKSFFGDEYYDYDKYFVYNLDKKGAPELFLYSSSMGLTSVFTYKNGKLVFLWNDDIYGINKKKKTLIVHGHWHGSGGTYYNEWSAYNLSGKTMNKLFYIDKNYSDLSLYSASGGYYVSYKNKRSYSTYNTSGYKAAKSKKLYKKLKKNYVKGTTKFSKFKKYKLSNKKGLNK